MDKRKGIAMWGRAAAYTLRRAKVVRGVITDMPFSLLKWSIERL